jgi:dTDP-4-dehydrorhamnose reductase
MGSVETKKILLLGDRGKMGTACSMVFSDWPITGKNHNHFDADNAQQVRRLIECEQPDIVINTIAFLGIDPCQQEPEKAFRLNTLLPKLLAELSIDRNFILVHFSTDAVFSDTNGDFLTESSVAHPLNIYGMTKYGGDCLIQAVAQRYYIIRIPVLFGPSAHRNQFVEKMLDRIQQGCRQLRIADDIITSPTYTLDIAERLRRIIEQQTPWGLYHLANAGRATLCELMQEVIRNLNPTVEITAGSFHDFPFVGRKNLCTPLRSEKIEPLRPWRDAVKDYCRKFPEGLKNA